MADLVTRAIVVLAAVAAAALLLVERSHADACHEAREVIFAQTLSKKVTPSAVDRVADRCRDSEEVAISAAGLASVDPAAARRLAEIARRRSPGTFAPWWALTIARAPDDPAGARRAWARAKQLNPRWTAPPPAGAAP